MANSDQDRTGGELKPCPFCGFGKTGTRTRSTTVSGIKFVERVCIQCGAQSPSVEGDPRTPELWELVDAAWNERTPDPRIAKLEAAMREACDLLAERKYGSAARSPGHNARLVLEAALKTERDGE